MASIAIPKASRERMILNIVSSFSFWFVAAACVEKV
jgi:hypothetical protein